MAISAPHYRCLRALYERGQLPLYGSLLEIGQANYYGDMPLQQIVADIETVFAGNYRDRLTSELKQAASNVDLYSVARVIYKMFLSPTSIVSIDFDGEPDSLKLDLNAPIQLGSVFSVVFNHGTAEHIFNVPNVFKVMHDHCRLGGLMIHESPFTGWLDHGFWNIQPTAYFDLAVVNGYEILFVAITHIAGNSLTEIESREHLLSISEEIPDNAMLFVAMKKSNESEFVIPIQGVYSGTVSKEAAKAWKALR